MDKLLIKPEHLKMLNDIFKSYCPNAEIWAYGSRLNGNAHEGSDLDLVVKSFNSDECYILQLQEIITNSNIPFLVDLHQYDSLSDSFHDEILKNYVVIYNGAKT